MTWTAGRAALVTAVIALLVVGLGPVDAAGGAPPPTVGPEIPTADPVPTDNVAGGQGRPVAAFDGEHHLVVWEDSRSYATTDVYGVLVRPDGTVVERVDVPISTAAGHQSEPDVTFDGTNFFVSWTDGRNWTDTDVYGARVSRTAAVLDPDGVAIATGPGDQHSPAQAFDGTNHFVTWADQGAEATEIRGARVSPAATVLDVPGIVVSDRPDLYATPEVAFNGIDHLVVWATEGPAGSAWASDVHGARVDVNGTVRDGGGIVITAAAGYQHLPAVASDGRDFLVVWEDGSNILGARVAADGAVLDPAGIPVASSASDREEEPAIAFGGGTYLVAWMGSDDSISGTRVAPSGIVLDPSIPIHPGPEGFGSGASVSFAAGAFAVLVAGPGGPDDDDVHRVRVDPAGAVVGTSRIGSALSSQTDPVMAVGAGVTFVAWIDNRGTGDLYGARVDADGTPLDGAGFLVAAGVDRGAAPAVSFDGTNFLVVHRFGPFREHELRGVRVSPAGAVLDPGGFLIHDGLERSLSDVHVDFDGRNHLVVWASWYPYDQEIHATRVTPDATVLDEPLALDPDEVLTWPAGVAFDGTNFLVVARRSYHDRHTINAIRVSPDGEVLGRAQVRSVRHEIRVDADVASDGTNHLVVWSETVGVEAAARSDVFAARVSAEGVLLDAPIPLGTGGHRETRPRVTANGNYLVVWRDERSGLGSYDVYGTRVTGTGRAIDGDGLPIAVGPEPELSPRVAPGPGDGFSVGYQRFVPEHPFATPRAFVRRVAPK